MAKSEVRIPGHVWHGDVVAVGCPVLPVGGRLHVGVAGARRTNPALPLEELKFRRRVLVSSAVVTDQSHVGRK